MKQNPEHSSNTHKFLSRRAFLQKSSLGMGSLALSQLLGSSPLQAATQPQQGVLGSTHIAPRAKRVIFLHQYGGVSQVDSFDYSPGLEEMHGQQIPASVMGEGRVSTMVLGQTAFPLVKSLAPFKQYGESGAWVSGMFPYLSECVDDLCFIKSMHTDQVNHDPAAKFLSSGFQLAGRPSMGAWLNYGLGSDNENLPSFIVMNSTGPTTVQNIDSANFGSGFLPSHHQGVQFMAGQEPVLYVNSPKGIEPEEQRELMTDVSDLARAQYEMSGDPEILSKISQYEMAYRMQTSVPDVTDISDEPDHILDMYGPDVHKPGSYARNCLLARRLAERNVKFTQIFHNGWDAHFNIEREHPVQAKIVDQPTAALVKDLKQRGLLEDTLVVWGMEFGRTPFSQGDLNSVSYGRDHHPYAYTFWLAGGGVNAGYTHGATDDFGYNVIKDPVHVHDFNATLLHLLGIDHERLTHFFQGRDFRLTDVHGHVVKEILA